MQVFLVPRYFLKKIPHAPTYTRVNLVLKLAKFSRHAYECTKSQKSLAAARGQTGACIPILHEFPKTRQWHWQRIKIKSAWRVDERANQLEVLNLVRVRRLKAIFSRQLDPLVVPYCSFAIYSRDTAIRISSVPRFRRKNPFVKISSWAKVMSAAKYFCRPDHFWFLAISYAKPYVADPGASLAGKPMGAQP